MTGFVYFVQSGKTGPVKIGYSSRNVGGRFAQLQRSAPDQLYFRGYMEGDKSHEAALHERFSDSRHRNEWFYPTKALLDYIRDNSITTDIDVVMRRDLIEATKRTRISRWPEEAKASFDMHGGETPYRAYRWRDGSAVPTEGMVAYFEAFLTEHQLWPSSPANSRETA